MSDDFLKCPKCKVTVAKDRIRIINRCRKTCPLNDMVDGDWKQWTPEEPKKKSEVRANE
jgi:hypothetical protein